MKIKMPYLTTSLESDIIVTLYLAPIWWVLGASVIVYQLICGWLIIKLILICGRTKKRLLIPKECRFLFLLIFFYGLSLLLNLPRSEMARILASLYNYSIWVMGLCLVIVVYNCKFSIDTIRRLDWALKVNTLIIGVLVILGLILWFRGEKMLVYPSPVLKCFEQLGSFPHFKATTTIKIIDTSWFASRELPRASTVSPYPTALGGTMIIIVPLLIGCHKAIYNKLGFWQLLLVGLGVLALLLSLSRTSVLALIFATITVYILNRRDRMGIISLSGLFLVILTPLLVEAGEWFAALREGSTIARFNLYSHTFKTVIDEAPIFGIGVKPREDIFAIPIGSHSMYMGLLFKTGFLGLFTFLAFQVHLMWSWCKACFKLRKLKRSKPEMVLWDYIGVSLIAMTFWMITEDLDAPQLVAFLYFFLAGIMLKISHDIHCYQLNNTSKLK